MARTCIYTPQAVQRQYAALVEAQRAKTDGRLGRKTRANLIEEARRRARRGERPEGAPAAEEPVSKTDDYLSKLVKYIPAELIVLTGLAFSAISTSSDVVVIGMVLAGALLTWLYLLSTVLGTPSTTPRPVWFYLLAMLAYVMWAFAVVAPVGALIGIGGTNGEAERTFLLAFAAFVVPALDVILMRTPRKEPAQPSGGGPSGSLPNGATSLASSTSRAADGSVGEQP